MIYFIHHFLQLSLVLVMKVLFADERSKTSLAYEILDCCGYEIHFWILVIYHDLSVQILAHFKLVQMVHVVTSLELIMCIYAAVSLDSFYFFENPKNFMNVPLFFN